MLPAKTPSQLHDAAERRLQLEEGARLALSEQEGKTPFPRKQIVVNKNYVPNNSAKKPSPPKGHEAFLKALETSGAEVSIEKCDGTVVEGVVKHSDKYTISVRVREYAPHDPAAEDGHVMRERVIFKHDISEFSAITPRVAS